MVLHDGPSRLRLDLLSGDLLDGPVSIRIRVDRLDWSEWTWTALRRLRDSVANGRLAPQPVARCGRRDRLILALRCWDARQTGASHRDLAALLVGPARARAEWRSDSDHLRSRVRRVLRGAENMIAYGWRTLLAPVAGREEQAFTIDAGGRMAG